MTDLFELPVGSELKIEGMSEIATVIPRRNEPVETIPIQYRSALTRRLYCTYAWPYEVEKILSVPVEAKEKIELPDTYNKCIVLIAHKYDRPVVFDYKSLKDFSTHTRIVNITDIDENGFGGSDQVRSGEYRRFRFDRIVNDIYVKPQ